MLGLAWVLGIILITCTHFLLVCAAPSIGDSILLVTCCNLAAVLLLVLFTVACTHLATVLLLV